MLCFYLNSICPNHMHSIETCQLSSLSPCQQKTMGQTFKSAFNVVSLLPEYRRSRNDHPTIQACVRTWNNFQWVAFMPQVSNMWTTRGTCVIALRHPPPSYKYSPEQSISILPPRHLAQTLVPPLAHVDAGDEVLSCRDFSDAVLTPAADLILSAAAVGVFRRQVS